MNQSAIVLMTHVDTTKHTVRYISIHNYCNNCQPLNCSSPVCSGDQVDIQQSSAVGSDSKSSSGRGSGSGAPTGASAAVDTGSAEWYNVWRQTHKLIHELYDDYDLDGSGKIDNFDELLQLSTNVQHTLTLAADNCVY